MECFTADDYRRKEKLYRQGGGAGTYTTGIQGGLGFQSDF